MPRKPAFEPAARLDIAGAIYYPKDCHFSPASFMAVLQSQLEQLGVKFIWQGEAHDFKIEKDIILVRSSSPMAGKLRQMNLFSAAARGHRNSLAG